MGIAGPDRREQSPVWINRQLYGIDHLGKHRFRGKQVYLHALGDGHLRDALFAAQVRVLAAFQRTRRVRLDNFFGRQVVVLNNQVRAFGNRPDLLVTVGGQDVEELHFATHDVRVRLSEPGEFRASAEHVVFVIDSITTEPVQVLIKDRRSQSLNFGRRFVDRDAASGAEQFPDDDLSDRLVAVFEQVDAVHCERLCCRRIQAAAGCEEVNESDFLLLANRLHGSRVKFQVDVVP